MVFLFPKPLSSKHKTRPLPETEPKLEFFISCCLLYIAVIFLNGSLLSAALPSEALLNSKRSLNLHLLLLDFEFVDSVRAVGEDGVLFSAAFFSSSHGYFETLIGETDLALLFPGAAGALFLPLTCSVLSGKLSLLLRFFFLEVIWLQNPFFSLDINGGCDRGGEIALTLISSLAGAFRERILPLSKSSSAEADGVGIPPPT
ncbi:hypothetical protein V2J09_023888 [Rumex salicifolius]